MSCDLEAVHVVGGRLGLCLQQELHGAVRLPQLHVAVRALLRVLRCGTLGVLQVHPSQLVALGDTTLPVIGFT